MPSFSGYPGVRKHGKNWQAKDSYGVYGTFADPYEAACALVTAQGKPPPPRRPNALECGRTTQQHIAALTTVLLAVPANQLMSVLANALLAVEQGRAQRAQQPVPEQQPLTDIVHAGAPPSQPVILTPPLTANEQRRAKRVKAIADWWRSLWAKGETFHLKMERPQLVHCFRAAETKRLGGQPAEYDAMDGSTFVKLLKQTINKLDGEVQRRPEGGGSPAVWWEIDAATYCPEELKETWQTQRAQRHLALAKARQQRQLREEAERTEQKVRDEEDRARTEEENKLRTAEHAQQMQSRYEEQSRRMQLIMDEASDEEEEEWESDDEHDYDDQIE